MISFLTAMALAAAIEPETHQAVCSVNDGEAIPCVVLYDTDPATGAAALGFVFDATTHAIYVGQKSGTQIDVAIVALNGEAPMEVTEGLCISRDGMVGCTATSGTETLKIIAAFE